MARAVTVNGISYMSITAAAHQLGIKRSTLASRFKSAGSKEISITVPDREVTIDGQTFESHVAAAKFYGINPQTFKSRLDAGWSGNKLTSKESFKHTGKAVVVRGVAFTKVKHMLAHFDVDQASYNELLRLGLNHCDAIEVLVARKRSAQRKVA
jgi:hypothetical protein